MSGNARVSFHTSTAPPRILDDDSTFLLGTIVAQSNNQDLEYTYVKEHDRLYAVRGATTSSRPFERLRVVGRDLPQGVVATFIDTSGRRIQYMKGPRDVGGQWVLLPGNTVPPARSPAPATNARLQVEILQQAKYRGTKPPDVPPIEYHFTRMSDIMNNHAVVRNSDAPAFDGTRVTNQKLSLRVMFPAQDVVLNSTQFNVRFGSGRRVISRGNLALHIAKELRALMEDAERHHTPLRRRDGTRVQFERLVLMSVAFASKGSIQPTIGVICE